MTVPIRLDPTAPEPKATYRSKLQELNDSNFVEVEISVEDFPRFCFDLDLTFGRRDSDPILFRGHADESWKLESTLEREYGFLEVDDYIERATACIHEIRTVLGTRVFTDAVPSYGQLEEINRNLGSERTNPKLPCIEFFMYLRHHGFPSPLLDWTRSPYVALFFAMLPRPHRDVMRQARPTVIVLVRDSEGDLIEGKPLVQCVGPYVTTHPRHYSQQTQFTYALQRMRSKDNLGVSRWLFHDHSSAIKQCQEFKMLKVVFPAGLGERREAIRMLQSMNITSYTLFGSEDSLIANAALREFELRIPNAGIVDAYESNH